VRRKKIKTFSVDEDVYNELVLMFKENQAESSLSFYVDNSLKIFLHSIKRLFLEKKKDTYTVPMSFIIDSMVRSKYLTSIDVIEPEDSVEAAKMEMKEWQNRYEAQNTSIPYKYYTVIKTGKFALSPDKKYVVKIETGQKFGVDDNGFMHGITDGAKRQS